MSISKRGEVELELEGELLVLVFNYGTLIAIEEAMGGRSIDELFLSGTISRTALTEAVRCGLQKNYRKKTRKQVAQMIGNTIDKNDQAYAQISRAVIKGILIANGAGKEAIDELERQIDEEEENTKELTKAERDADNTDPPAAVALTSTG